MGSISLEYEALYHQLSPRYGVYKDHYILDNDTVILLKYSDYSDLYINHIEICNIHDSRIKKTSQCNIYHIISYLYRYVYDARIIYNYITGTEYSKIIHKEKLAFLDNIFSMLNSIIFKLEEHIIKEERNVYNLSKDTWCYSWYIDTIKETKNELESIKRSLRQIDGYYDSVYYVDTDLVYTKFSKIMDAYNEYCESEVY